MGGIESFLVLLALFILIAPFIAIILAAGARSRLTDAELTLREQADQIRKLRYRIDQLERGSVKSTERPVLADDTAPAVPATVEPIADAPIADPPIADPPIADPPIADPPIAATPIAATPIADTPIAPIENAPVAARVDATPEPSQPAAQAAEPNVALEQKIGTLFTRLGAGALLLGVLYFFKYAADNDWIGPAGRVALGALAGVVVLAFAERTRENTQRAYSHALLGVGIAILYIASWASHAVYDLVPTTAAFVGCSVIALLGAALAYRHNAQAVLFLVLIATFANPVMLSTGQDRPFALFGYLLVMTGICAVVSVSREFRGAPIFAMLGVIVLFVGWYDRYYEIFDHREWNNADVPPETLVGAYLELASRWVPLLFSALFSLKWIATAHFIDRRATEDAPRAASQERVRQGPRTDGASQDGMREPQRALIRILLVSAWVLSHGAATSLLYDQPNALGIAMIVLAVGALASAHRFQAHALLVVPLVTAFLCITGASDEIEEQQAVTVLAMTAAWGAVYLVAFLRAAASASGSVPSWLAGLTLALIQVLALVILLPHDLYGGAAMAVAVAHVVALAVLRDPRVALASAACSSLLFIFVASITGADLTAETAAWNPLVIAGGAIIAFAQAGRTMLALQQRTEERVLSLIGVTVTLLAFAGGSVVSVADSAPTLRAVLVGATAIVTFANALFVRQRREDLDLWVQVLAALSLALAAPAIAFAFSGATITVIWAVLTGVALVVYVEARKPIWLFPFTLLLFGTVLRVFAFDYDATLEWVDGVYSNYYVAKGLLLPAFLNARALAFGGSGLLLLGACIVSYRRGRGEPSPGFHAALGVTALAAYTLLTFFFVLETRQALLELPPLPVAGMPEAEANILLEAFTSSVSAQQSKLGVATTIVLGAVALALLGLGFQLREKYHRYLGLVLFIITVSKLVLWDVWNLPRVYQIVVLAAVGVLLLASGFLYARIRNLFRDEAPKVATILFLVFCSTDAFAQLDTATVDPTVFTERARLTLSATTGYFRFTVGEELYRATLAETRFADIRIRDPRGREAPFFVRTAQEPASWVVNDSRMFDSGTLEDGRASAMFELTGSTQHCGVDLDLPTDRSYLRTVKVETGVNTKKMTTVVPSALVYRVQSEAITSQGGLVRYPPSVGKWVRVTVSAKPDEPPVPIAGARFYLCSPTMTEPRTPIDLAITSTVGNEKTRQTIIDLDAGFAGRPIDELEFAISTPTFTRRIEVRSSSHRTAWPLVTASAIHRAAGSEEVKIRIPAITQRYIRVVVFDDDNASLTFTGVRGSHRQDILTFRAEHPGEYELFVGNRAMTAPRYDLEATVQRFTVRHASMAALSNNPALGRPESKVEQLPATERYRRWIIGGLCVLLFWLGVWALRILKTPA